MLISVAFQYCVHVKPRNLSTQEDDETTTATLALRTRSRMSSTASEGGANTSAMPPPKSTPAVREKCSPKPTTKRSRRIQSTNVSENPHVRTPDGETPSRRKKRLSRIRAFNSRYKKNGAFFLS